MKTINQTMLSGNLGKDPETRYLPDGTPVTTLSLAVHSRRKQGDEYVEDTDWYSVSVWGNQAEWTATTLKSGMGIIVSGRLRQSKWVDNTTQMKRIKVEIVADNVYLLPNQSDTTEQQTESPDQEPAESPPEQHAEREQGDRNRPAMPTEGRSPMRVTPFPQAQAPSVPRRSGPQTSRPVPRRAAEEDEDMPF